MSKQRRAWLTVAAVVVVVSGCGGGRGPSSGSSRSGPVTVVLFGDSLAYQARPYFDWLVQAGGKAEVRNYVFGGTAVCDWLPDMRREARSHPDVAVLEFSGNTFTKCMGGCQRESTEAVDKYCFDVSTAIHLFLRVGTRVFLEGTPINRSEWLTHDPHWDDLNRAFAGLAAKYPGRVSYVDAGRAVEGSGRSFAETLACLSFEPCNGPTIGGIRTDVVRAPDGVHFCPDNGGKPIGQVGLCDTYSSGAFRFASAMAGPIIEAFHLQL